MEYKQCLIVATDGNYMKRPIAWIFPKDSPYIDIFNFYFQKFDKTGLWYRILKKYQTAPQNCPDLNGSPIDFSSCFTAFCALFAGIAFSLFLILTECCRRKLKICTIDDFNVKNNSKLSKANEITEKIAYYNDIIESLKAELKDTY